MEQPRGDVAERAQPQVPLVAVGQQARRARRADAGGRRPRPAEPVEEVHVVRQQQRAVVEEVVAAHPLAHRRLGRGDLERGVRLDGGHGGVEARVARAAHADAAVVGPHVGDQPLDGVVGVAALVDVARAGLGGNERPDVGERAFAHPAAAHVLVHDDVVVARVLLDDVRPAAGVVLRPIRRHAVGRARHHDGVWPRRVLGHVDGGEQPHAVPHRDHHFVLDVGGADVERGRRLGGLRRLRKRGGGHEGRESEQQPASHGVLRWEDARNLSRGAALNPGSLVSHSDRTPDTAWEIYTSGVDSGAFCHTARMRVSHFVTCV